jgi:inorganic triphosphatase YgiF
LARPASPTHVEVEIKLEADADAVLPDLSHLPGVFDVRAAETDDLDAVYFDTDGLCLIRAGITLRRRSGGIDEGWHLKLPGLGVDVSGATSGSDATPRLEVHRPLGRRPGVVPAPLLALVAARLLGAPVAPVARIRTARTRYDLIGVDGEKLAEVADDAVTAGAG